MRYLLIAALVGLLAGARSLRAQEDSSRYALRAIYYRLADTTLFGGGAPLWRTDIATGDGAPEQALHAELTFWTAFPDSGTHGVPGPVLMSVAEFARFPQPRTTTVEVVVDGGTPRSYAAEWNCPRSHGATIGARTIFQLSWAEVRSMGNAKSLFVHVGPEQFQVDGVGIARLAAFAQRLPPDSAKGAYFRGNSIIRRDTTIPDVVFRHFAPHPGNENAHWPLSVSRPFNPIAVKVPVYVMIDENGLPAMTTFRSPMVDSAVFVEAVRTAVAKWRYDPQVSCGESWRMTLPLIVILRSDY